MLETLTPLTPDSAEERVLEDAAFAAANSHDVPAWAQETIKRLWREVVAREKAVRAFMEGVGG